MPQLDSFRRTGQGNLLRIRHDDDYWSAVQAIQKAFPGRARYDQDTREFYVPTSPRNNATLATIFPEDWPIIQAANYKAVNFTPLDSGPLHQKSHLENPPSPGDPILIRVGAGTKRDPHRAMYAFAGRSTPTRLYYRDAPNGPDKGPLRLASEGSTWKRPQTISKEE